MFVCVNQGADGRWRELETGKLIDPQPKDPSGCRVLPPEFGVMYRGKLYIMPPPQPITPEDAAAFQKAWDASRDNRGVTHYVASEPKPLGVNDCDTPAVVRREE